MHILNKYLDLDFVLWHARPKGIIEAGAFTGEIWETYEKAGVKNRCWIEGDKANYRKLKANVPKDDKCLNVVLANDDREMVFNIVSDGQSSSVLKRKLHKNIFPQHTDEGCHVVSARSMDSLIQDGSIDISLYDMLVMDLQGAEDMVLRGFENNLHHIKAVVAEVNYAELYKNCMLADEFDDYMARLGFQKLVSTEHKKAMWGDTYYNRLP